MTKFHTNLKIKSIYLNSISRLNAQKFINENIKRRLKKKFML